MIDLEEIEREISLIENTRDTTYRTCERLAWLYVCRDHLTPSEVPEDDEGGSDFLRACSGVNRRDLMRVLDEHMSALFVINPKMYESTIDRIRSLK